MVKVITIMDDVYADLYKLKKSKSMSFSEVFRYLLKEKGERSNIISLAGSIDETDINHREAERIKRDQMYNR